MADAATNKVVSALGKNTGDIAKQLGDGLGGQDPAIVLAFASTEHPLADVLKELSETFPRAKVLGASTAGEFNEKRDDKGAISAVAVAGEFVVNAGYGTGLKESPEKAVGTASELLPETVDGYPHRTGIILLDPMAGNGEEAVLLAASTLGPETPLAGGAAGDDLKMTEGFVGVGAESGSDAVVIATIHSKKPLAIGVAHGHSALSEPLRVTKAEGNVVYEIEGRPAWDVWAERTKEAAAKRGVDPLKLSDDEIGAYLLQYEAGLATGSSLKIRAPLARGEDGSLSFATGIPEGATFRITESEPSRQVESARAAARAALEKANGEKPVGAIVFDCICRNLILGDEFATATAAISEELGGVPLAGFETYGEIALAGGDLSGFHNTTTVLLAIPS